MFDLCVIACVFVIRLSGCNVLSSLLTSHMLFTSPFIPLLLKEREFKALLLNKEKGWDEVVTQLFFLRFYLSLSSRRKGVSLALRADDQDV